MPPEEQQSAVQDFFNKLPTEDKTAADIFGTGATEEPTVENTETQQAEPEKDQQPVRPNRRERRESKQLQWEREQRIAAEARAKAFEEARSVAQEGNVDERLIRLYGADNLEAAKLHQQLLNDARTTAEDNAYKRIQAEQAAEKQKEREFESFIDDELGNIEEDYNVDVTSDSPAARKARREFLELVQKISPKDSEGNITAYADFNSVWEMYQANKTQTTPPADNTRAKEVAARSMEKTATGTPAPKQPTPGFRGWMRDFNIN
jgi:hypothetical protein